MEDNFFGCMCYEKLFYKSFKTKISVLLFNLNKFVDWNLVLDFLIQFKAAY